MTNAEPVDFKTFLGWIYDAADGAEGDPKRKNATTISVGLAKPLIWFGEKVGKVTRKRPLLTVKDLGDSVAERWFDNGRAKELLGYVPKMGLKEGVRKSVEGYKAAEEKEGKESAA